MTSEEWDAILLAEGPDALLNEIHVLRRALHALAEHVDPARHHPPIYTHQHVVDHFVAPARKPGCALTPCPRCDVPPHLRRPT